MKNKFILLAMLFVSLSLFASACSFKTETSESYTDPDGNTTTTTRTNDNGNVTTETTTSSSDEEEDGEEIDAEGDAEESSGTPADVTSFAESLATVITEYGVEITITETVDNGGGNYTILTDSEMVSFAMLMDGSDVKRYGVTVLGDTEALNKGVYTMLIAALLEGDEKDATYEAIVTRGETPVETADYTFAAITSDSDGIPFAALSADVK